MKFNIKKILIFILLITSMQLNFAANVIFDIFGVLFEIPKSYKAKIMGKEAIKYMFIDHKNPGKIGDLFMDMLSKVPVKKGLMPSLAAEQMARAKGGPMPPVMFLWQANIISGAQALDMTLKHIEASEFSCEREKQIMIKCSQIAFDFETRKDAYKPIKEGIKILTRCAKEVDQFGQKKNKIFILSNMDTEMMDHLVATYPEIFCMVDGITTSAGAKCLKPDDNIYKACLTINNIKAEDSYFIDDQQENVDGGERAGIRSILCKKFNKVAKSLEDWEVISKQKSSKLNKISKEKMAVLLLMATFYYYYPPHGFGKFKNIFCQP